MWAAVGTPLARAAIQRHGSTTPSKMGLDQNEARPVMESGKWMTKVNSGMVAAVVVFLLVGAAAILWLRVRHGR
jgi:hypothetical protein